jgi:hypothetical protein
MGLFNNISFSHKGFLVGFFGDIGLQLIVHARGNLVGLKDYFELHSSLESACLAGGLMYGVSYIYDFFNLPIAIMPLFIYGGLLDIVFRQFGLMKTLNDTYYENINELNSFIWGGIPMVLIGLL